MVSHIISVSTSSPPEIEQTFSPVHNNTKNDDADEIKDTNCENS